MKTPYPFILDALEGVPVHTRPMFGCLAVYLDEKILLILRQKTPADADNGCWVATVPEHHDSLGEEFPSLRALTIFGPTESTWRNLPESAEDFESAALEICDLIRRGDPRIGKVPVKKRKARKKSSVRARGAKPTRKKPSGGKAAKKKPKKPARTRTARKPRK